ncbi:MAG TPA: hypothetical protein VFK33_06550 [Bacillales bacterium]|nr:hypothetical protein [Bacillales bacterium]
MIDIEFKKINIGSVTRGHLGVFNGQNALYGWNAHLKQTENVEAFATFFGNHSDSVNILIDRDVIDSHFFEGDREVTAGNFVNGDNRDPSGNRHVIRKNGTSNQVEINGKSFNPKDL